MMLLISARELEILRKAIDGLSPKQIAEDLNINSLEVHKSLKSIMKNTQSKEPVQAMQVLARNGFQLSDQN